MDRRASKAPPVTPGQHRRDVGGTLLTSVRPRSPVAAAVTRGAAQSCPHPVPADPGGLGLHTGSRHPQGHEVHFVAAS